jgi:hypothetical protein
MGWVETDRVGRTGVLGPVGLHYMHSLRPPGWARACSLTRPEAQRANPTLNIGAKLAEIN